MVAMGRLRGWRFGPRSKKGRPNKPTKMSRPKPTIATPSSWPGKYFKSSNAHRKYHSGRGIYAVSLGFAGGSDGTPAKTARQISTMKIPSETTASLAIASGQKSSPSAFFSL